MGGSYLFVPELDYTGFVDHDLIPLVFAGLEQLWQSKPLAGHLVPVIRIDKLIVIDAVWCVTLHALDCRLTAVKSYDVVDETLAGWRKLERLGRIGSIIFGWVGLTNFKLLAGYG